MGMAFKAQAAHPLFPTKSEYPQEEFPLFEVLFPSFF